MKPVSHFLFNVKLMYITSFAAYSWNFCVCFKVSRLDMSSEYSFFRLLVVYIFVSLETKIVTTRSRKNEYSLDTFNLVQNYFLMFCNPVIYSFSQCTNQWDAFWSDKRANERLSPSCAELRGGVSDLHDTLVADPYQCTKFKRNRPSRSWELELSPCMCARAK